MRACIMVLLFLFVAGPVCARSLELSAQGSTGLTFNDNITLSRADVNFGPGVLAKQDLIGAVRVRTALRREKTELAYVGSRVHFYDNPDLGYVENALELAHEEPIAKSVIARGQAVLSRVDNDLLVRADANGVFPFTTSEPPDRQLFQLVLMSAPEKPTTVSLRGIAQDQQYSNNPLLDADARAVQLSAGQVLDSDKKWSLGAEGQRASRDYPNLVGPVAGSIVETHVRHVAAQVSYLPNKHFGFLAKSLWLDQYANVDAFFLEQLDLSLGATWEGDRWGNASFLAQFSRRDFARRVLPGGDTQLDHDLLLVFSVTKRLGERSALTVGYTHDRNQSNSADSDYSNNVERFEFSRSF